MEKMNVQELSLDDMDKVAGGSPVYIVSTSCPHCHKTTHPEWSAELNMYICSNSGCRGVLGKSTPDVQGVV